MNNDRLPWIFYSYQILQNHQLCLFTKSIDLFLSDVPDLIKWTNKFMCNCAWSWNWHFHLGNKKSKYSHFLLLTAHHLFIDSSYHSLSSDLDVPSISGNFIEAIPYTSAYLHLNFNKSLWSTVAVGVSRQKLVILAVWISLAW